MSQTNLCTYLAADVGGMEILFETSKVKPGDVVLGDEATSVTHPEVLTIGVRAGLADPETSSPTPTTR